MARFPLNLLDDAFQENPWPGLKFLRDEHPVCQVDPGGLRVISRYDDIADALSRPADFSSAAMHQDYHHLPGLDDYFRAQSLISMDPPLHTRRRRIVTKPFTLQSMRDRQPAMESLVSGLFGALARSRSVDFIRDFAVPLPVTTMAHLLGVSTNRLEDFKRWSDDIISFQVITGMARGPEREAREAQLLDSAGAFHSYFSAEIDSRRDHQGDDLISLLLRAGDGKAALSRDEIIAMIRLLLGAGNESSAYLMGFGLLALHRHPQQWTLLQDDPDLVDGFIEEVLRYTGPFFGVFRTTTGPVSCGGVNLPAGAKVLLALASSGRDERKFEDPDRFDITRHPNPHLGFGAGVHICLGMELARLQARCAFRELIARVRDFTVDEAAIRIRPGLIVRGLQNLPVQFTWH